MNLICHIKFTGLEDLGARLTDVDKGLALKELGDSVDSFIVSCVPRSSGFA